MKKYINNILVITMLTTIILVYANNSLYLKIFLLLLFLVMIWSSFKNLKDYRKKITKIRIEFSLKGIVKKSKLINIGIFILLLLTIALLIIGVKNNLRSLDTFDLFLLCLFGIWSYNDTSSDKEIRSYKFTDVYIIEPGLEFKLIEWADIVKFEKNEKRNKFNIILKNNKQIYFKMDQLESVSNIDIYGFIEKNTVQQ